MNISTNDLNKSCFYSFIIYFFVCISILLNSFLNPGGYLSPDSTNYLALAQNLIDNGNYYVNYRGEHNSWFAVWPIGYPTMIFGIAKITGASVFLASKILNLLVIGIIFVIFNYKFKEDGFIFSSIFLFHPFLLVFSYTWSEVTFLLGMLLLGLSLYSYIHSKKINYTIILLIGFAAIFLFLSRYIGAFSVGVIGITFVYLFYLKDYKKSFILLIPLLLTSLLAWIYLYNNYLLTGFYTGTERFPAPESIMELLKMTIKAFLAEFNLVTNNVTFNLGNLLNRYLGFIVFLGTLFLQYYIFFKIFKKYFSFKKHNILKDIYLWEIFLVIGVFYYGAIIFMRWSSHFDGLNYRLLIPGTFLLLISFILFSKKYLSDIGFFKFKLFFIILAVVSYSIFTFRPYIKPVLIGSEIKTYNTFIEELHGETKNIPFGSVVVMANNHLNYLRIDLIKINPKSDKIYLKDTETWDDFMYRISNTYPQKDVYLYVVDLTKPNKVEDRFHSSVVNIIKENQEKKILKLQ